MVTWAVSCSEWTTPTGTAPLAKMVLCDPRGNVTGGGGKSTARVLIVTPLGRAMVLADEAQVAFHGGC